MGKFIDLTGQRFGRLTVIERACPENKRRVYWVCRCDCGNYSVVAGDGLKSGGTKSCGCLEKENLERIGKMSKHGMSKSKLHRVWRTMKSRCYNTRNEKYNRYGGRGITVCGEWLEFEPFMQWAFENGYADGLTIERIDNDKPYCPENCRWATNKEQANNKSTSHFLTYNGETHTIAEWAEIVGMKRDTLKRRIYYGWSIEKALTEPVKQRSAIKAVNK